MNFTCDNCQRRYTIADEKVRGKTVKVRCRHCEHLISVTGPADAQPAATMMSIDEVDQLRKNPQAAPPPAAAPAPVPPGRPEWYVMVKGKQTGPMDLRGLGELLRVGEANDRSYVWKKGMAEWKRGAEVPELAALFTAPPAPPPQPAPTATSAAAANPFEDEPLGSPQQAAPTFHTLSELFSDADAPRDEPLVDVPAKKKKEKEKAAPADADPFAALGEIDPAKLPPVGEATAFFIAQAGVNKRNPPWKIAAFIGGGVGIVAGVLFLLSSMNIVPLTVHRVDATGQEVEQSVFSGEGISALGDLLTGKNKKRKAEAQAAQKREKPIVVTGNVPPSGANMPKVAPATGHEPTPEELAALYGDTSKADKGPRVRRDTDAAQKTADTSRGGLSDEQVAKVVAQSQSAFQNCIEQELRKNPNLRVPRFYINATVTPTGVVRQASIDRREVDLSPLGECLKTRARRMVFAQFSGDEVEVQIPLIVGVAM